MSDTLRVVLILASIGTGVFIISRIRKHKLNIEDAIVWLIWSIFLLFASIFTKEIDKISKALGFITANNFVFTTFIFYLYIISFFHSIKISHLKEQNKSLIQRLSIDRKNRK